MFIIRFVSALLALAACLPSIIQAQLEGGQLVRPKSISFGDPNTRFIYRVEANQTAMKMYRRVRGAREEVIQRLDYKGTLVDFDLHCLPNHCYMAVVTNRPRQNLELFHWQRVQFDLLIKKDTFARPYAVKMFRIQGNFYVAIAQEQLHLNQNRILPDYGDGESARFMGSAILKFSRGREHDIKYHQFIRLPFNPYHVVYFTTINSNDGTSNAIVRPTENHHLVFSIQPNWTEAAPAYSLQFVWSPLNDYFWPYRLPRGAEVNQKPGTTSQIFRLPVNPPSLNLTQAGGPNDLAPIESCFYQLQRLLVDRDLQARRLIQSSRTIWRSPGETYHHQSLTDISAQVIVHGNVTVRGSLIESPQISLIGGQQQPYTTTNALTSMVNYHSPTVVDNKLKRAFYKLKHIREKLSHAVLSNVTSSYMPFNSQLRTFSTIEADEVIFIGGVANSNVRLNGIPFNQLEHELVGLNGAQDIGTKVIFAGAVFADLLEIHGKVNNRFYLRDAIDITSRHIQVIDATGPNYLSRSTGLLEFRSVSAPEVILSHNATINTITLGDFVVRDNRTQFILGRKMFRRLHLGKLDLAHQGVQLNGLNLSRIAADAIRLREPLGRPQILSSNRVSFTKPISVNKLIVNGMINQHINLSILIQDSVKASSFAVQQISGHKNFLAGLKIAHLTTDGSINGVQINQVFNTNPAPPLPEYGRYFNNSQARSDVPITGSYRFESSVTVHGRLNAGLINNIDITRRAIRRPLANTADLGANMSSRPQIIHGRKLFVRPLRILDRVDMIDGQQVARLFGNNTIQARNNPVVNGVDLRQIKAGLLRQMQSPRLIYVDNLEVDGNLDLPVSRDPLGSNRITLGNFSACPMDALRTKLVIAGSDQIIDAPIRVNSLRAKSINVEPGSFNGLNFPDDFVLRSNLRAGQPPELVYGHKTFDHIIVSPPSQLQKSHKMAPPPPLPIGSPKVHHHGVIDAAARIIIDRGSIINQIGYSELQNFMIHERQRNSTGEKVFNTLNVYGNIRAKRINGNSWPDDILLKSASSNMGYLSSTQHKRIYSPLVFVNTSSLKVENQLVLRGPIQLYGRMNNLNLTEFARQSATYGDKDLMLVSRPIRNKIFMGGLSVKGEMRSQGSIDGVNIDELINRVVVVGPSGKKVHVTGSKVFLSDVEFNNLLRMNYLNDIPFDHYLGRINFNPADMTIRISNKKTITGALRSKNLIVRGLINGVDFADLKAKAISLSKDELQFNKTLTIEGDVFMDNLLIDERNGTIDGIRLTNLLPIGNIVKNELILTEPTIRPLNYTQGVTVSGAAQDCLISCTLLPPGISNQVRYVPHNQKQTYQVGPPQPPVVYPPRPIVQNGRNVSMMYTPPPYIITTPYQRAPMVSQARTFSPSPPVIQNLALQTPLAIRYDHQVPIQKIAAPQPNEIVRNQLNSLRHQLVSYNLLPHESHRGIVIGFIDVPTSDIANLQLPGQQESHRNHKLNIPSYLELDQTDFQFNSLSEYHMSAGVLTVPRDQNATGVYMQLRAKGQPPSEIIQLSSLPVESPNSAKFLSTKNSLFLLVSQDYTVHSGSNPHCVVPPRPFGLRDLTFSINQAGSGIHVYLFHILERSSSLPSAYFDLYQSIDLPSINAFEEFKYLDTTYLLAVSASTNRIYLLLPRGYSGFQIVSYIDAPMLDYVKVYYKPDRKPALIIHQTNGLYRLMESVVI